MDENKTTMSIEPKIIGNSQLRNGRCICIETSSAVCSRETTVTTNKDIIESVEFCGSCSGNTQGLSVLLRGMKVSETIEKLKGINCGGKGTSCPDQLARGLEKVLKTIDYGM